ncbi:hypothetical protein PVK64_15210 [Aliivibrio sp. S4TY2]|uniref:hypothetical protein n=1 Tax=unclassified Aliivibrio TaxID=2645654 RepID=UPI002377E7B0|nr:MULTISPECIES: hypothetical protein [unclassified Aliivibrio]MDD9157520.1 hypothetical protein [Aliivibrio sp. S4TY2]MDD9161286.1 hypothetical protein [Aliivibrio sp. S4TY1]MDD9165316.1 hypothetical protein [Aliivibrio sp. S4MY2]MDD9169429.1 hypothetical protein [Aliivibrio sp. S4MY4]MDD9186422.1 hypothetical protein [Aliivibrio sp. S4MY3]
MFFRVFFLAFIFTLTSCATTDPELESKNAIESPDVNFIIGNVTSIYNIKLSIGNVNFENETFKEDWFSSLSYEYTKDKRYIVGTAKAGSYIGITSTKVQDASGTPLGIFTPCNKTLVFRVPYGGADVYVTDVNYEWNNVSISPIYSDQIEQAKKSFNTNNIIQARYLQLNADLYNGCETLNPNPVIMTRPI